MPDHFVFFAVLLLLPIVALLRFVGCNALTGLDDVKFDVGFSSDAVTVSSLESGAIAPLGTRTFDAIASWDSKAKIDKWEVQSTLPIKGGITAAGKYTAPEAISGPVEEQVVAHAKHGPVDVAGSLTVTVDVDPKVTVDPPDITLRPGDPKLFSAKANWDPNSRLASFDWEVNPGTATSRKITGGNYRAPATAPSSGLETVRATAKYGATTVEGQATVRIVVPPPSATFKGVDPDTHGKWKDVYGTEGWALAAEPSNLVNLPSFLPVLNTAPLAVHTFVDPTTDPRALQKPPAGATRFAAVWFDLSEMKLEFNFSDFETHRVAIYCVDWTLQSRKQKFEFSDISQVPHKTLDTQSLDDFGEGKYLKWDLSGKVQLTVTHTPGFGPNAVISGIFFVPPPE